MAKKKNRNEQKRHLLERDNSLCGIHMEGCGKPINSIHSCNVDHIIPQKIFKQLAKGDNGTFLDEKEYNRWWNKQPMHTQCNTKRGTGYNRGWPNFTCKCHFLYFHKGYFYLSGFARVADQLASRPGAVRISLGAPTGLRWRKSPPAAAPRRLPTAITPARTAGRKRPLLLKPSSK